MPFGMFTSGGVSRLLRLRLVDVYRRRGEMLSDCQQQYGTSRMLALAKQHDIAIPEVCCMIQLHLWWDSYVRAEAWCFGQERETPWTCAEALNLIEEWRRHQN